MRSSPTTVSATRWPSEFSLECSATHWTEQKPRAERSLVPCAWWPSAPETHNPHPYPQLSAAECACQGAAGYRPRARICCLRLFSPGVVRAAGSQLRKPVTCPAHGLNEMRVLGVGLYLPADVLDVYVRSTGLAVEVTAPEVRHDVLPMVHLSRVGGQQRQDLELFEGQLDGPTTGQHLAAYEVYGEPRELQPAFRVPGVQLPPSQVRPHPADELTGGEWFRHVVVGPDLQAHHDASLVVAGGDHDHGHVAQGAVR